MSDLSAGGTEPLPVDSGASRQLPTATRIAIGVVGVTVLVGLNWVVGSVVMDSVFGGSALAENVRGEHYFLANHGRLTEVTPETFWSCYWYRR